MVRQIIHIDEDKCNGCGICATACHEGAIEIIDGKAKLVRENFCDGFGDCLPGCPMGAITFEEREAPEYDEAAVKEAKIAKKAGFAKEAESAKKTEAAGGVEQKNEQTEGKTEVKHQCPGSMMRQINRSNNGNISGNAIGNNGNNVGSNIGSDIGNNAVNYAAQSLVYTVKPQSELINWPVQIKLAPVTAPYFDGAKLLVAADCTAYAYASFHQDFIKGKVTLIGCPKLDAVDYSEKLTEIIAKNNIQSVTIVRMEVPCCGGLEMAAKKALQNSGKFIPWQVVTISIDGNIID